MSLQGSLETFALPDVLVLLSSTKKDGELRVVGGRVDGKVWLEKGQIVHSVVGGKERPPVDAVFELLRLESGTFNFEADSNPPSRGDAVMIDLVLADAQVRLAEWNEIAKVVPHLDAVVDMAAEAPSPEVIISRDQWALLRHVAGGQAVSALMSRLGDSEFDACRKVKDLVEAKLATIDVSVPKSRPVEAAAPAVEAPAPAAAEPAASPAEDHAAEEAPAPKAAAEEREKKRSSRSAAEVQAEVDHEDELQRLAELAARESQVRPSKVRANTAHADQPAKIRATAPSPAGSDGEAARAEAGDEPAAQPVEEAKALVAQLAAIGGADESELAEKVAKHVADGGELPPVIDGDEPINRGLLLKFLSSVRN